MLSKQLKSKASVREALPLKDAIRYLRGSAFSVGEGAVLKRLIWGLGVQKGSGAYTSPENLTCPRLRLFWKMPSQILGPEPSGLSSSPAQGRVGRCCTSKGPPHLAAETRRQGQRWVDLKVFFLAWNPAAALSGAPVTSSHTYGLAS